MIGWGVKAVAAHESFLGRDTLNTTNLAVNKLKFDARDFTGVVNTGRGVHINVINFSSHTHRSLVPTFVTYTSRLNFRVITVSSV